MHAIVVEALSKRFDAFDALKQVSFAMPQNEVFCILGPNGAGKTTLIRILTTITRPTSGNAFILGKSILKDTLAVRAMLGVVSQENHFDRYFSVWHNLTLHAQMHGLAKKAYESRIQELMELVGLYAWRKHLPDELSGGMQRRIALIRALIHEPKVLFLDEPSTGLDPQARLDIWKAIESIKDRTTVVLTTHYMEEADCLSDQILLLNHGQVVRQGTARELKRAISPLNTYQVELTQPHALQYAGCIQGQFAQNTLPIKLENDFLFQVTLPESTNVYEVLHCIPQQELLRFGQVEADLEDVFMTLTQPDDKEAPVS